MGQEVSSLIELEPDTQVNNHLMQAVLTQIKSASEFYLVIK